MGKGKWSVAQMVATTEKGISQMYERGLKQMENAKTKFEYLQAADVFISIAYITDPRKIKVEGENNQYCLKSREMAKKCIESAEQCVNDGVLKNSDGKEKNVNIDELCAVMKKRLETTYEEQNTKYNFDYYLKSAEEGNSYSQYTLGHMYYYGQGVPRNCEEAEKWLKKAAQQDHITAQYILGNMYYKGEDVPQNYAEAFKWYEKMAEQGDAWAQNLVGLMCFNGTGVEENKEEAKKWLRKAAVQGYEPAKDMLQKLGE